MTETNKNIHQEAEQEITLIDDQGNEELYQVLFLLLILKITVNHMS